MMLALDDYLIKQEIVDISRIKNNIVIHANRKGKEKRFEIRLKDDSTLEEIASLLEAKLDKALGRESCQYIIQFICKPENWEIFSTPEAQLKQKAEQQLLAEKCKSKCHYDSFEQWQVAVETAYHELHKTVDDNIPQAWSGIEFILSVKAILHIKEITLPYIGIILGPPAGVKTVPLKLLRERPHTFFSDKFNPAAMISHVILPIGMKEGEQHMLNKMKNNLVLAPELAPLFAKRVDELREVIALLTRVADGDGFESDSGLGHKGVTGKVMFVFGGAAVEFPPQVYAMLTNFGPKIYFSRLPKVEKSHEQYVEELKGEQFTQKFQRIKDAMSKYLDIFESCPTAEPEEGLPYYLPKISLEKFRANDCEDALDIIVYLGKLLKHLRAVTWTYEYSTSTKKTTQEGEKIETTETEERDFSYNTSVFEEQDRANRQHYNLALGHALSMGRTSIGIEDIPLIVNVTLSTAPQNRHRVFELLLENGGTLTTQEICDELKVHRNTANKTMTELVAVGLAKWSKTGEEHSKGIELTDGFSFFTEEEFDLAKQDDYKRYHEYLENLNREPNPSQDEEKGIQQ